MITKKEKKQLQNILDKAVDQEKAFNLDELLGFLFGMSITPDVIVPNEWLPVVFGEQMFEVDTEKEAKDLMDSLFRVLNKFSSFHQDGRLEFPFDYDLIKDKDFAAISSWTAGFDEAILLRPEIWAGKEEPVNPTEEQENVMSCLTLIHCLACPDDVEGFFGKKESKSEKELMELHATLFANLPLAVETLQAYSEKFEESHQAERMLNPMGGSPQPLQSQKVGRNEPCPCGSGKKYKKCCLKGAKVTPLH